MPKQLLLLTAFLLSLWYIPSPLAAQKSIQTTQDVVVIDPGHGGQDTGIVSNSGIFEKDITLKLAQKTAELLENTYNVFLTRNQDLDMEPSKRSYTANRHKAQLFISIHLHSHDPSLAFIYYFHPPNAINLPDNSWKKLPLKNQKKSKKAAAHFSKSFRTHEKTTQIKIKGIPSIVLEGTMMPAVLIEPFSIRQLSSNQNDIEKKLDEYALLLSKSIKQLLSRPHF